MVTEGYILCVPLMEVPRMVRFISTESRMGVARSGGIGMGSQEFNNGESKFQFDKMNYGVG